MSKYDDDPYIGPLYRVGQLILSVLGIVFYLPAGIIVLCVRLKIFGRILMTILMAAIGFFGVGILWAYIFYHPEIAGLIGALIFGTIGCIFGWRKAVPLAEIPMFEAAKKVCLHILKMFFILITLATHVGILFESLMGDYSERVMVIGLILIVIYWLIVLVTPPADPARAGTKKRLRWRIAFAELIGFCFVGFTVFVIKSIKSSRQANVEDFIGPLVGYLVLIALLAVSIVQVVKAVRYNKRLEHETQSNAKGG